MSDGNGSTWKRRRARARSSVLGSGEPMIWLTGGMLAVSLLMILGLVSLVVARGLATFWPQPVVLVETTDGRIYMGEETRSEPIPADASVPAMEAGRRHLLRTGNFRITQTHFQWVADPEIARREEPPWAVVAERLEWGRFYGEPLAYAEVTLLEDPAPADPERRARRLAELADRLRADGAASVEGVVRNGSDLALVALDGDAATRAVGVAAVQRGAEAAWGAFEEAHPEVRERWRERRHLEKVDTGEVNHRQERARLELKGAERELEELERAEADDARIERARRRVEELRAEFREVREWTQTEFARIREEIDALDAENARHRLLLRTAGEGTTPPRELLMGLDEIVRAYPANRIGVLDATGIYAARWAEFLTDDPREANSEGGVFPAIFGTVVMTLVMSIVVVPFGVLAALYLREYARAGLAVSAVRIAVNNLAGVPSIVFGVFGLGFFCYMVGAGIDELLFEARLPNPTYGKGGILWASLTLALLTLPVVIVATEEALAAVPNSMREGSYACGASKWQTIRRIVLPRAMPGIITGMILAIARGAGEVAPLMLVGAVKLAPELPVDGVFPFIHPERSFMHLGFHIYDVGFQSQNSEAAKPMVFTTTLLLVGIVALLNLAAVWLRRRLRRRFVASQF